MKKNRDSDALAARLTAAGNQPPVVLAFPATTIPEPEASTTLPVESEEVSTAPIEEPKRKKPRKARASAANAEPDDNTVPISLRPRRELLTRYVVAASERTRDSGRVISAQQIMLEILEAGP
jgi:hypothetical protein